MKIAPRNPLSCNLNASSETSRTDCEDVSENQTVIGCDLSLRLGSFMVPCTSVQNALPEDDKAGDICKLNDLSPQFNIESVLAKRKLGEDQQIYCHVKLPFNKFRS
ncbi:hypothetical protein K7X08_014947 [Anisodus acutangulus]|uniref:Uncharacterized protein n=1 Tax=Anisodus acutangulus TaxID=402998 RepID=A0A9Q1R3L4_9SOLA|nr:hypothetical protein K7X08_014947 [Anisodus acutangulus]